MSIGLNTALKGLSAAQRMIDVAGHNLANVNTEGYSRQRVELKASQPLATRGINTRSGSPGHIGSGVEVSAIQRVKDQFLSLQLRNENTNLGYSTEMRNMIQNLESVINEPSEQSLNTMMQRFWNSWQDLSSNPGNQALRVSVVESAKAMTDTMNQMGERLYEARREVNSRIKTIVGDVNNKIQAIADLNKQIKDAVALGDNPNDLMDQRDLAIDKLSKIIKIKVVEEPSSGAHSVYIGGDPIVASDIALPLRLQELQVNGSTGGSVEGFYGIHTQLRTVPDTAISGFNTALSPSTPSYGYNNGYDPYLVSDVADIAGGELKALLDIRDITLYGSLPAESAAIASSAQKDKSLILKLDEMARALVTEVNAIQTSGLDLSNAAGQNFFDTTSAFATRAVGIRVSNFIDPTLGGSVNNIAAAAAGEAAPGGSGNAVAIAQLRYKKVMGDQTYSPGTGQADLETFFATTLTQLGTQGDAAARKVTYQEGVLQSITDRINSTSGVSNDEELANVLKFQRAYQASARMVSVIDQMLETVVNLGR
jgi:flagellar hook-associated protein 1